MNVKYVVSIGVYHHLVRKLYYTDIHIAWNFCQKLFHNMYTTYKLLVGIKLFY